MPDGYQYVQGRSRILSANYSAVALGTAAMAHAAVTDTGADQTITTAITDPTCPRNVTATAGGTATDVKAVQVIVTGTNAFGEVISETLPAFTVNSTGSVTGSKAFATVTSILLPAHDGTGATTSVGYGAKLGLPATLSRKSFVALFFNGVAEAISASTVSSSAVESNTVTCTSALNGSDVIVDYYK